MKNNFVVNVFVIVMLSACRQPQPVTNAPVPPPTPQKKETGIQSAPSAISTAPADEPLIEPDANVSEKIIAGDSIMAFIVSFYSIGEGIDRGMPEKLKSFVVTFGKKNSLDIRYTETHWGREGETDYCFPLKGLPDSQLTAFITGAKDAIKAAEHVHYLENQPCRKGR